jgi:hypothetical protein
MIIAKDLPKMLWAEVVNYATWLKNRMPSRAIPVKKRNLNHGENTGG